MITLGWAVILPNGNHTGLSYYREYGVAGGKIGRGMVLGGRRERMG